MFKKRRLLALFWLLLGGFNLLRAGMAQRLAGTLEPYPLAVPLPFLGWLYTVWGSAFLIGAVLAWGRRLRHWAVALALTYQATLWMLRLFAYRADYARGLWARDLLLTGVFILVVTWLAYEKKPRRTEQIPNEQ